MNVNYCRSFIATQPLSLIVTPLIHRVESWPTLSDSSVLSVTLGAVLLLVRSTQTAFDAISAACTVSTIV